MGKNNIIFYITIIIGLFIGIFIAINIPTSYKIILVDYKFTKGNDYYIIGETIVNNKSKIDLYKVNSKDYNEFLEGFEYSISTKNTNSWSRMHKEIVDFKQMKYD